MVNRCVKDRQRSPSGRHLIFLVTFNPINPACSLTTHLWVLTEDPNRHIFNTWVTRCKFVCLGWAKFRGTRRLAVPGQSDLYQSKWYTACLTYQKGKSTETITLSDLRWYPACGTDKLFCPLNNSPITQTFKFSTDMHSKNQIVVLANNLVTVVARLSFPCCY